MIYPPETQLEAPITDPTATTLTVISDALFGAPIFLVIDTEIIYCPTEAADGTFSGVTRGALGSTAETHAAETAVYGLYSTTFDPTAMGGIGGWWDQIAAELGTLQAKTAGGSGYSGPTTQTDQTANRSPGNLYTNSGPTAMWITATFQGTTTNDFIQIQAGAGGSPPIVIPFSQVPLNGVGETNLIVSFVVPAGSNYQFDVFGSPTVIAWIEWQ